MTTRFQKTYRQLVKGISDPERKQQVDEQFENEIWNRSITKLGQYSLKSLYSISVCDKDDYIVIVDEDTKPEQDKSCIPEGVLGSGTYGMVRTFGNIPIAQKAYKQMNASICEFMIHQYITEKMNEFDPEGMHDYCARAYHHGLHYEGDRKKSPSTIMKRYHSALDDYIDDENKNMPFQWDTLELFTKMLVPEAFLEAKCGLFHMDIKPLNMLYDETHNRLVYSDFGLMGFTNSKFQSNQQENSSWFTIAYCPPEVFLYDYFKAYQADVRHKTSHGKTKAKYIEWYNGFRDRDRSASTVWAITISLIEYMSVREKSTATERVAAWIPLMTSANKDYKFDTIIKLYLRLFVGDSIVDSLSADKALELLVDHVMDRDNEMKVKHPWNAPAVLPRSVSVLDENTIDEWNQLFQSLLHPNPKQRPDVFSILKHSLLEDFVKQDEFIQALVQTGEKDRESPPARFSRIPLQGFISNEDVYNVFNDMFIDVTRAGRDSKWNGISLATRRRYLQLLAASYYQFLTYLERRPDYQLKRTELRRRLKQINNAVLLWISFQIDAPHLISDDMIASTFISSFQFIYEFPYVDPSFTYLQNDSLDVLEEKQFQLQVMSDIFILPKKLIVPRKNKNLKKKKVTKRKQADMDEDTVDLTDS